MPKTEFECKIEVSEQWQEGHTVRRIEKVKIVLNNSDPENILMYLGVEPDFPFVIQKQHLAKFALRALQETDPVGAEATKQKLQDLLDAIQNLNLKSPK